MVRLYFLIAALFLFTPFIKAQVVVYNEDFTLADGTTSDAGVTPWTRTYTGSSDFEVSGNTFIAYDLDAEGVWSSGVVDISTYGYAVVDIAGYIWNAGAGDYLRFYYKIDGGAEILFGDYSNGFLTGAVGASAMVSGSTIQVVVRAFNNGFLDLYEFDDVVITGIQTLYSRKTGNWTDNNATTGSWSIMGHSGAACGCIPNDLTRAVVGNSHTITVDGGGEAIDVNVKSGSILAFSVSNTLSIYRGGAITVENGGSITGGSGTRQIIIADAFTNSISVDGTGTLNIGDFVINAAAAVTFSGTGSVAVTDDFLVNAASTVVNNITGSFAISDDLNFNTDNASFTNNRSISMADLVVNDNADDGNSFVNASTATLTTGTITANNGNLTINNSGTINQSGSFTNNTLDTGSSFTNQATGIWNWSFIPGTVDTDINSVLNCSAVGNTFNYSGGGAQSVRALTSGYHHLSISNSGTKALAANTDINGDLIIQNSAVLNSNAFNITLGGNWSVLNTASFTEGATTATVTLDGSGSQSISNASGETFNRLIINKPAGSVTLNNQVTITNTTGTGLTLTQGIINSTSSALLILNDGVTTNGGDSDSFVDGPIRKVGNDAFIFPTGDGSRWARIGISALTGVTTQFTAQYFATPYSQTNTDVTLTHVSGVEHWVLDRAVTTSAATVTLYWQDSFSDITNFADLRVARYNGTDWVSAGNAGTSGTTAGPGTITSASVTSFSPFSFGSGGGINPLPIELNNFQAKLKNHQVELTWETASETDNDFFTIERASDVEHFEMVGERIKGKGTTNQQSDYKFMDTHPLYGRSYYRLKQTDFDGTSTYSQIRVIDFDGPSEPVFEVHPTLGDGTILNFYVQGLKEIKELPIKILNVQGQVIWQKTFKITFPGYLEESVQFDTPLPKGFYIVRGPSIYFTQKIVIE